MNLAYEKDAKKSKKMKNGTKKENESRVAETIEREVNK